MVFSSFVCNDKDDGVAGADECCDVCGLSAFNGSSFRGGLFGMLFVLFDDDEFVITLCEDEVLVELKEVLFNESEDGMKFRNEITLCVEFISNSQPFGFCGDGGNGLREPGSIDNAALN